VRTRPSGRQSCADGFTATLRGRQIKRVVFRLDGRRIASRRGSPFEVRVPARPGSHMLTARVTFKDATRARTVKLGYRICASVALHPRSGPPRFPG
jgi:hypothetical protein